MLPVTEQVRVMITSVTQNAVSILLNSGWVPFGRTLSEKPPVSLQNETVAQWARFSRGNRRAIVCQSVVLFYVVNDGDEIQEVELGDVDGIRELADGGGW